jgi:fatty-acyl-CoA synthase
MTTAEITEARSATSGSGESALQSWVRALEATAPITQQPRHLLLDVIAERARTHGDAPALISDRETLTYQQLVARANRYARWALTQKLGKGETVCLLMPNQPDYLAKIGRAHV